MIEYDDNKDSHDGLVKWPFYLSALFIFALVVGFAYVNFETTGTLDHWQIITCSLASGLASILIFLPHLFDNFLFRVFDPINRKDEELIRKVFFDLKEMRGELDAISVKIDKVPTLVDKIVSDAQKPQDNPALSELSTELAQTRDALESKLARLEELSTQAPLLPEPDPGIAQANDSISKLATALKSLGKQIDSIQSTVSELPTEFPEIPTPQPPKMVESSSATKPTQARAATVDEILSEDAFSPDTPAPSTSATNPSDEEAEKDTPIDSEPEPEEETEQPEEIIEESPVEPEEEPGPSESAEMEETDSEEEVTAEPNSTPEPEEEEEENSPQVEETEEETENPEETPEDPIEENEESDEPDTTETPEELDLGLPDPEETIRKVDALLAGESTSPPPKKAKPTPTESAKPKSATGITTVVANVMIGIGNKPFLRGEGPGLNWDEGVPMNFVEIGKWAWSPSRKNASLTVQVYRNDEDPDQGGKFEIKPSEKLEITPDFG